MFSLKSFIQSIQEAILNANDALMDKNMEVLNRYFEFETEEEIQQVIDDTIEATEAVVDPNSKVSRESLNEALKSLKTLRRSLSSGQAADQLSSGGNLHPKTVTLNYPTKTKGGTIVNKEVHVPLVTLVPISFSQVEQLKLEADLELNLVDDEVQVSLGKFGNRKKGLFNKNKKSKNNGSIGSIEILIKPQEMSDGMQHIVDAYEKVLKAQLPV